MSDNLIEAPEALKQCTKCGEAKRVIQFYRFHPVCRKCMRHTAIDAHNPYRSCTKCGETKASSEFRATRHICKVCSNSDNREKQRLQRSRTEIDVPLSKGCNTCGIVKPRHGFTINRSNADGLSYWCRECTKKWKTGYIQRTRLSDPKRFKMLLMLYNARNRDRQRGGHCDLTIEWLMETFGALNTCPILGIQLDWTTEDQVSANSPTLDAIIPELGHIIGNVQLISHKANTIKSNATLAELQLLGKWAASQISSGRD